jgi:uncharacterized membrane protein YfcA
MHYARYSVEMLLLLAFTIALVAAAVQAATGFGFGLVSVPLLAVATDPRTAVVASTIGGLATTVTAAIRERDHVRWRIAGLLLAAAMLGMPIGLLVLRATPERLLTALIGAMVVVCAVLVWRGLRVPGSRPAIVAAGLLAGVLSTSTGTNGPPLVAALHAMEYDPRTFRATLAATFTGTGVVSLAGFTLAGQVSPEVVQVGLVAVPAVLLGWWGGNAVFHRIEPRRFRRLVLVTLIVAGTGIMVQSLASAGSSLT